MSLDWQTILEKGVTAIAPKLFEVATSAASKSFQTLRPYSTLRFDDHFKQTFQRCTKIKTIVNGDSPIDLLSSYINLNFRHKKETLDDLGLIDEIWAKKYFIISGAAGSGKSMFMRYLWVSCFVQSRGKIPLFVELRRLNSIDHTSLVSFLFYSCAFKQEQNAREIFERALDEGQFFLIFDGFDEINPERKSDIEKEILEIAHRGQNVVVVSSREDDRFNAWQYFYVYHVQALSKNQVISLIERVDFDITIKKKFISEIRKHLYDKHIDFVSRPLLATMMLLTFNSFAEIPERIHVFYNQVFDTLFSRHDATKEAFKRVRHTSLSIEEFKRLFGMFCLLSYLEEKIEFSEESMRNLIHKSILSEGIEVESEKFLLDMLQTVCLIQREGLLLTFSHRSFQEYFTAFALTRLPNEQARKFANHFTNRTNDNVFPILYEMNRSFFQDIYVLPGFTQFSGIFEQIESSISPSVVCHLLNAVVLFQNFLRHGRKRKKGSPEKLGRIQIVCASKAANFLFWLPRLYGVKDAQELMFISHEDPWQIADISGLENIDFESGTFVKLQDNRLMHYLFENKTEPNVIELTAQTTDIINDFINSSDAGKNFLKLAKKKIATIRVLIKQIEDKNDQLSVLTKHIDRRLSVGLR